MDPYVFSEFVPIGPELKLNLQHAVGLVVV